MIHTVGMIVMKSENYQLTNREAVANVDVFIGELIFAASLADENLSTFATDRLGKWVLEIYGLLCNLISRSNKEKEKIFKLTFVATSMTLDCAKLVDNLYADITANNDTDYMILDIASNKSDLMWTTDFGSTVTEFVDYIDITLEEDIVSFVNFTYLKNPSFFEGLWSIALAVLLYSFYFSCISFPIHMSKQKRIQLRILQSNGFMDSDAVLSLLHNCTDGQFQIRLEVQIVCLEMQS